MDPTFEQGDPQKPKGHALAYFRNRWEPGKIYATYIIVLPISVDFAKYVPPFLASHLGSVPLGDFSAFSLPPVPEEVESYERLQRLADIRGDDLLAAGTTNSTDPAEMMQAVSDVVSYYARCWDQHAEAAVAAESTTEEAIPSVNEVLYGLMGNREKLADLAKLMGKLRFAVEGNDYQTGNEIQEDMRVLGRFLPEDFDIPSLITAAVDSSAKGAQLAQLYLDRCYKLSNGDQAAAQELEEKIKGFAESD